MSNLLHYKEPDNSSVYQNILKMGKFSKKKITDEILSWLHIAFITLSPTIIDAVKNLRTHNEIKQSWVKNLDNILNFEIGDENLHIEGKTVAEVSKNLWI